jgi:hypothetical protein
VGTPVNLIKFACCQEGKIKKVEWKIIVEQRANRPNFPLVCQPGDVTTWTAEIWKEEMTASYQKSERSDY